MCHSCEGRNLMIIVTDSCLRRNDKITFLNTKVKIDSCLRRNDKKDIHLLYYNIQKLNVRLLLRLGMTKKNESTNFYYYF